MLFLLSSVAFTNTFLSGQNPQTGSLLLGYLEGKGGNSDEEDFIIINNDNIQQETERAYAPIAQAASVDFIASMNITDTREDSSGENDSQISIIQDNSFVAPSSYYDESAPDSNSGNTKYVVQSGDTPSSIATAFGISTNTILWANNLMVGDYIKPGQELKILPVTGVEHIIAANDTIDSVASKYKAGKDEIIVFNGLPADGSLTAGRILIIPNGEKEAPVRPRPAQPVVDTNPRANTRSTKYVANSKPKDLNPLKGHRFPYGQCTWYVASKVFVPWGGDAKFWIANAKAYGYQTGKTPVAGSIVATNENKRYGHVAYVESVNGDGTITISEMNYVGWGRVSVRVLSVNSPVIRGYIYVP